LAGQSGVRGPRHCLESARLLALLHPLFNNVCWLTYSRALTE
jgi:hypothetical protein